VPRATKRRGKSSASALKARIAELEREGQLLNAIANYAPSLICLVDADGRVRPYATNRAFERTLGYQPHETGGVVFWERYVPDGERAAARDCILTAIRTGTTTEHDGRWLQRDGGEIDVAWACTGLPMTESGPVFLVSGTDITDRKRHEAEVRK
jgi:PAS domain S-box-containing protein